MRPGLRVWVPLIAVPYTRKGREGTAPGTTLVSLMTQWPDEPHGEAIALAEFHHN
jgi:hypothetical protein